MLKARVLSISATIADGVVTRDFMCPLRRTDIRHLYLDHVSASRLAAHRAELLRSCFRNTSPGCCGVFVQRRRGLPYLTGECSCLETHWVGDAITCPL